MWAKFSTETHTDILCSYIAAFYVIYNCWFDSGASF